MSILYRSDAARAVAWASYFARHAPDLEFRTWPDAGNLRETEYLIAWQVPADLLAQMPNLKVLFSSGAGIDHVDLAALPAHVPLVRMIEPGIINGMVEYVSLAVLALHRDFFHYMEQKAVRSWNPLEVPSASSRTIGVMGLGSLGCAVLDRLASYGFRLRGWNRSPRAIDGVQTFAGADQLQPFLAGCDILVCLLPLTPETRHVLNRALFAKLNRNSPLGAPVLINAGRGGLQNEADILQCLDDGTLGGASLDVYGTEPLPPDSRFWTHPKVVLTPHNAADTDPDEISKYVARQIERFEAGGALENVVDRSRGY